MKIDVIKELLEKYYRAETTLEEEEQLEIFFTGDDVPDELRHHGQQFRFFIEQRDKLARVSLPRNRTIHRRIPLGWIRNAAAVLVIFATGWLAGSFFPPDFDRNPLSEELDELKLQVLQLQLGQTLASERIKGIRATADRWPGNDQILQTLITVLNTDRNTNVRIEAANALFQLSDAPMINDWLITALENQSDPLVKVTLISMLLEHNRTRATLEINKVLEEDQTPPELKEAIRELL